MQDGPLRDQPERTRRQVTTQETRWRDGDECLVRSVADVKVRWRMIIEVHGDDDPEESTDLGHASNYHWLLIAAAASR